MKKGIILVCALFGCISTVIAQNNLTRRPDWTFEKPKAGNNATFYYHVEQATAENEREARNLSLSQAFMQAAMRIGVAVDVADVSSAIANGGNLKTISERYEIPISIVCSFPEKRPDGTVRYWLLCQIAKRGGIIPTYDEFSDCYKFDRYEEIIDNITANKKELVHHSNTRAIVASAFIPGLGQMLKGQGGSGAAFLISEVALFGGGTACYFLGQDQAKIMKSVGTTYEQYTAAKNMKNVYDIAMYTAFGVGAVVHIGNMVHAWVVKDKHLAQNITFAPAIIPTNEYTTPSYAYGAGVQIKF